MKSNSINPLRYLAAAISFALSASMAEESAAAEKKEPKFASKEYDMDTGVLTITFGNDEVVSADINSMPEDIRKQLALHGLAQKVGDSYAGAKGNYSEAIGSAKDVIEQLLAGVWKAARGESDARPRLAELAEAIARIKSVPLEKATAAVEASTEEQRKAWRGNSKVKAVIAAIKAEKAAAALEAASDKDKEIDVDLG